MLKKLLAGLILLVMLQLIAQSAFAVADQKDCPPGKCHSESQRSKQFCFPCDDE